MASDAAIPSHSASLIPRGEENAQTYARESDHTAKPEPIGLLDRVGEEEGWNIVVRHLNSLPYPGKIPWQHWDTHNISLPRIWSADPARCQSPRKIKKRQLSSLLWGYTGENLYLGYCVSHKGVQHMETKVRAVHEWATPQAANKLWVFLGLISYYQRFIKNLARVTAPLYCLLSGRKPELPNIGS